MGFKLNGLGFPGPLLFDPLGDSPTAVNLRQQVYSNLKQAKKRQRGKVKRSFLWMTSFSVILFLPFLSSF